VNNVGRSSFVTFSSGAMVVLTSVLLLAGGASAKGRKGKPSDTQAHVVAHVSFSGLSLADMAMQKQVNGKYYLYVQHARDQGISIIDISQPAQPKAVGVIPWPDPTVSSTMAVTGDLAIIAETEAVPRHSNASHDSLVLWDLSNPAAPRVVQTFTGVARWLQDERDFMYVLNDDGLWVVSKPTDHRPEQFESTNSY